VSEAGLTEAEAGRRLTERGERETLPSSRTVAGIVRENTLTLFNLILVSFFVLLLIAGDPADGLFLAIAVANSAIGIVQELRSKRALDAAALLVAPKARVVRDGTERSVAVDDVVDGDLVRVGAGDQIVADGDLVVATGLQLDESPLTGESEPVGRAAGDRVLSGSFAVEGSGEFVATGTGAGSYASQLLGEAREHAHERSPLEVQINRLLTLLVIVMVPLGAVFIFALIHRDVPFREAAATSTAGIVTLVPEGLVLLTSLTFAMAAARLTQKGMLVQYLNAVESLANVDTVCLDKTGTLTDGNLSLVEVIPLDGSPDEDVRATVGRFAASAAARNETLEAVAAGTDGERVELADEVPFSSRWKWSAVRLASAPDWLVLGAPEVLTPDGGHDVIGDRQSAGRRVLVFGTATDVGRPPDDGAGPPAMRPVAAVVLSERLRSDTKATVEYLQSQGVALKVMSGDSPVTVAAIAADAGIDVDAGAMEGRELPEDEAGLRSAVAGRNVFARLQPHDKRRLVEALRSQGAYVAMIGDGVNDVPAMKRSRLGIGFGSGSQLAKSVADCVLVDNRFGSIPEAIGEGRRIIGNVQRVACLFVTKSVFAAAVILTFGILTSGFPLLPRHLSLAATFTVGIPAFVLALSPIQGPAPTIGFLRRVARFAIPAGVVLAGATILAYLAVASVRSYSQEEGRTAATTVYVAVGLYLLLVLEADRMQASRRHAISVLALVGGLASGYLLVLGSNAGRDFFALAQPGLWVMIVCIGVSLLAFAALSWLRLSPYRGARPDTSGSDPVFSASGRGGQGEK
jgi:magnesium-transporting ATPase (P-type)